MTTILHVQSNIYLIHQDCCTKNFSIDQIHSLEHQFEAIVLELIFHDEKQNLKLLFQTPQFQKMTSLTFDDESLLQSNEISIFFQKLN